VVLLAPAAPRVGSANPPPAGPGRALVNTTLQDFFMPGTQPTGNPVVLDPIVGAIDGNCANCHANFDPAEIEAEPFRNWVGGMMAQAMRDPEFLATMTIANQDAAFAGDLCLRCHTPAGWLGGRSLPTDGSSLSEPADFEGVTCHFCHRLVNPQFPVPGDGPASDDAILTELNNAGLVPAQPGGGRYVLDPDGGARRGPRDPNVDGINHPQGADALFSPFHTRSDICATCHDVSNPVFVRQLDGTYAPGDLDAPHPTMDKYEMFPVERTYSEWSQSQFASGGVDLGGRFGGNHPTGIMETCQDCHMPDQIGPGCRNNGLVRPDAPQHALNGGNTWVLASIRTIDADGDGQPDYPDAETGLTDAIVQAAQARVTQLLENASDMELTQVDDVLQVRITNYTGHKLPSGYPEGRRLWINVRFLDDLGQLCAEHGAYDALTAELTTEDTKVYETKLGLDATMATLTGLPEGESFHFALNNVILKDNRIPPVGFTNAGFDSVQAGPVAYSYADGQYWDDTEYTIPACAATAEVALKYQSTSKEYIEFLLNENVTDNQGQIAYDQWVLHGRSAPVTMDTATIDVVIPCPTDINNDGSTNVLDLIDLLLCFGQPAVPGCESEDVNADGTVNVLDLIDLLLEFGQACP
jgi:mono/diheme cytochrome c family protein